MTLEVVRWPTVTNIDNYAANMTGIAREEIVRDIVRIVSVADMVERDVLNNDWVLAGGMAMRLRGSPRFTRADTDSSRRNGLPTSTELLDALRFDTDDLTITPEALNEGKEIKHVAPVEFKPYFDVLGDAEPDTGSFQFTVSGRGLIEPADSVPLQHPYPDLVLPAIQVPLMNLTEQVAEKICGWCAHGLVKHYMDVAWAFDALRVEIDEKHLAPLVQAKLVKGQELFPSGYEKLTDIKSLLKPLAKPDEHHPPMGDEEDDKRRALRFSTTPMDFQAAKKTVFDQLLPTLITSAKDAGLT